MAYCKGNALFVLCAKGMNKIAYNLTMTNKNSILGAVDECCRRPIRGCDEWQKKW